MIMQNYRVKTSCYFQLVIVDNIQASGLDMSFNPGFAIYILCNLKQVTDFKICVSVLAKNITTYLTEFMKGDKMICLIKHCMYCIIIKKVVLGFIFHKFNYVNCVVYEVRCQRLF